MTDPSGKIDRSLEMVKTLVLDIFKDDDVGIILFGSRARGDSSRHSDIDIGIIPRKPFDRMKLILLKDKLENINIPYKVDVVDISKVSKIFREKALKEGELWKN